MPAPEALRCWRKGVITLSWFEVGMLGLLAGVVGTGAGGVLSVLIKKTTPRFTGTILAFAAGVMGILALMTYEHLASRGIISARKK